MKTPPRQDPEESHFGGDSIPPEESRKKFESAVQKLRSALDDWLTARREQFEQVLRQGWSLEFGDPEQLLQRLDRQSKRFSREAERTNYEVEQANECAESAELDERLESMKSLWDKLRAEGVPIDQRPLDPDLPFALQFHIQASSDPTGKDMEWWKAHQHEFASL